MADTKLENAATRQLDEQFAGYTDEDVVTVTHGYGRVPTTERRYIDSTLFIGGVARHVPYATARKWKAIPVLGKAIHVLPDDATDADLARVSGIQPMATPKFAAMLSAMDLDKLVEGLDPAFARSLADKIVSATEQKVVRSSNGQWVSKKNSKNAAPTE